MKKVLVTGASGFIGRHCLPLLKKRGYEIYALSSKAIQSTNDIHWIQCDLLQSNFLHELLETIRPTYLLHLAWNATPGKFWTALDNLDWLKASISLLKAFVLQGGKRVVMAGTCAEYDWGASLLSEKETACLPHSLYGTSKLALHLLLQSLAQQIGFSQAWGRIFYLYGPHEYPQRFIPAIIKGLLQKAPIPCSHCNQIRDFLYVEDVADAFVTLLESEVQGAVNIASGVGISLKQVIKKLTEQLGGEELLQFGTLSPPPNDPAQMIATTQRLSDELQWRPRFTLEEGLMRTIHWSKESL